MFSTGHRGGDGFGRQERDGRRGCGCRLTTPESRTHERLLVATDGCLEPRCSSPIPLPGFHRLDVPIDKSDVAALVVAEVRAAPGRISLWSHAAGAGGVT